MDDLAESYQDIDRRANARREYDSLTQASELPFRDFFTKFKRLGGELAINESTLMDDLAKKLNPKLNTKFTGVSGLSANFITLLSMRDYLIKTDNTLRSQDLDKQTELAKQALVQKKTYTSRSGRLSPSYVVPARRTTPVATPATPSTSASKTPFTPVVKVKEEYVCFQCGRPGHQKKDCPNEQTQAGKKAALDARLHAIEAYDTEDPIDNEEQYHDAESGDSFDSGNA